MRTLGLLAALLVLALPGRAEPLEGAAEQVADTLAPTALTAEDRPEGKEQDVSVSFYGDEHLTREASGSEHRIFCVCRATSCQAQERPSGSCGLSSEKKSLCCRRHKMY